MVNGVFVGNWFGVPVWLHISWVVCFLLLMAVSPYSGLMFLAIFILVLMHEFGHIFAAKYFDIPTRQVILFPFGGLAQLSLVAMAPHKEFVISAGGPLVNLVLYPVFYWIQEYHPFLHFLSIVNVMLIVFNVLVVAFPLDGGRMLRSFLAMTFLDFYQATKVCVYLSAFLCSLMAAWSVMNLNFMLFIIAVFIFISALQEYKVLQLNKSVKNIYEAVMNQAAPPLQDFDCDVRDRLLRETIDEIVRRNPQATTNLTEHLLREMRSTALSDS